MKKIEMQAGGDFFKTKNIPMKIFSYYQGYFHDGGIDSVTFLDNEIVLEMESAQIYICDNKDRLPLSESHRISGRLHAKGVISLKLNDQLINSFENRADYISVLELYLSDNQILFFGIAEEYDTHQQVPIKCELIAKEIYWENTAYMIDPALLGKYMGLEGPPPYDYPQWYIDKYGPQGDEDGDSKDDSEIEYLNNITPKDLNN